MLIRLAKRTLLCVASPTRGLALTGMIGQMTFLGDTSMAEKFGRRIKSYKELHKFAAEFEVEGYLQYRGDKFVKDLPQPATSTSQRRLATSILLNGHNLPDIFKGLNTKVFVLAIKSGWVYPTHHFQIAADNQKYCGGSSFQIEISPSQITQKSSIFLIPYS